MSDRMELANEKTQERATIRAKAVKILQTAKDEERSLSPEERTEFDKIMADVDKLQKEIDEITADAMRFAQLDAEGEAREKEEWVAKKKPDAVSFRDRDLAFRAWLLGGYPGAITNEMREAQKKCNFRHGMGDMVEFNMPAITQMTGPKTHEALREARQFAMDMVHTRATTAQTITTTAGGNLIGEDQSFINRLQEHLIMNGTLRNIATVINTDKGDPLPVPGFGGNQAGVNTAINTDVATADSSFSQQELGRNKYGTMIKLPIELITDSGIDIQGWCGTECGRRLNRVQEQEWATGASTLNEAPGVLTTGSSGGAAAGSVAQSSAGNIGYADLNSLIHDIDPNFRTDSQFVWHDTVQENVVSQLDSNGLPLFRVSTLTGEPDSFMGYRAHVNNLYPSFTGASTNESTKLMSFGRHRDYFIRDVRGVSVQALVERYAETGQVAVLAWAQSDGQYINPHGGSSLSSIKYMAETAS